MERQYFKGEKQNVKRGVLLVSGASASATNDMKNTLLDRGFNTTPTFGAYVSGAIGTSSGAAVVSDTSLTSIISGWNNGADFKGYESGFPKFDTTARTVTTRLFVTSTQANSNILAEYGDFNGDTTPKIGGHFTYTPITKNSSIQVFFIPRYLMK